MMKRYSTLLLISALIFSSGSAFASIGAGFKIKPQSSTTETSKPSWIDQMIASLS